MVTQEQSKNQANDSSVAQIPSSTNTSEDETAPIAYFSSSSAADTGPLIVEGLDADGALVTQVAVLAGLTKTALTTPLWRCFRVFSVNTASQAIIGEGLSGNVYIYEDDTVTDGIPDTASKVRSFVLAGQNQTLQSTYTVPAGKTGFLTWARSAIATKGTASCLVQAWVRPYGFDFRLADTGAANSTGTSVSADSDFLLSPIPEKTDLMVRVDTDTNSTLFTARFDILLVDNDCL